MNLSNYTFLLKKVIQSQDLDRVAGTIQSLMQLMPAQQVPLVVSQAIAQIVNEDLETFTWLAQATLPQTTLIKLGEVATHLASEQLVAQGFEFGKHFTAHPEGGMVVDKAALDILLEGLPHQVQQTVQSIPQLKRQISTGT